MTSKIAQFMSVIASGLLLGAAGPTSAQSADPAQALLDSEFVGSVGVFIVTDSLKASLNGQSTQNPEVDFDNTFGKAKDATRWRVDGLWRITPKHHLRFMYFNNSSTRTKTLGEDIRWGDYTFLSGAEVSAQWKQQTAALAYEYAFLHEPSYEVSASIGVHYSKTTLGLSGAANITNPDGSISSASFATKNNSVPVPLPVVGVQGGWVVGPHWYLAAGGQFFKMNQHQYDGHWSDLRASATWMYSRNFGVGLGVDSFTNNVKVSRTGFDGRLRTGYSGLQLFMTGAL